MKEVIASGITEHIKKFNQSYRRRKQKTERRARDCKLQLQEKSNQLKENPPAAYSKIEKLEYLIDD